MRIFVFAMHQRTDNYTYLTQAPVRRVILTMGAPTIVSMLVTSLYNMADTYFVGKINTQATAAVGVTFAAMSGVQAVAFLFGHGSGNYIAQQLGARHRENAARMAATGFGLSIMAGVLIAMAGLLFLTPLSLLLGSTATILPYTERYLGIVLLGVPFMTGSLTLNNQMRFQGNAARAMLGVLSGALLNIALAPLFIFSFEWGITGAAVATVVSQACGFGILYRMSRTDGNIRVRLADFSPSWQLLREIFMGGMPSLLRQGLACTAVIVLNVAAGAYGDAAIAGMSIVGRISFFIYAVIIGLGQGFQPLCGFCYGARLYGRVREGFAFCVKAGTAFLVVCAVVCGFLAEDIVTLFRHDPEVVAVGAVAFRFQLIAYPLLAFVGVSNQMLQTMRLSGRANLVAAARSGLFFIPLALTLPEFFGLLGVELIQAVSDVCAFILTLPIVTLTFRRMEEKA